MVRETVILRGTHVAVTVATPSVATLSRTVMKVVTTGSMARPPIQCAVIEIAPPLIVVMDTGMQWQGSNATTEITAIRTIAWQSV